MKIEPNEKKPSEVKSTKTRGVDLSSKELVSQLRRDGNLALEKIKEVPQETIERVKPLFHQNFLVGRA
tara:strand:+ start:1948 stop:2151 length:204 start_codon:yes stop_codon:yes gene_type:complete